MGLSQKDMEFLNALAFTKEEIFGIFAPGLASALAINATEANSVTGKATLVKFAVWPLLVALAEKITNGVLPCYDRRGSAVYVGEFSDIRATDRRLQLEEINTFARFHSVDEVRARFHNADALPNGEEVAIKARRDRDRAADLEAGIGDDERVWKAAPGACPS